MRATTWRVSVVAGFALAAVTIFTSPLLAQTEGSSSVSRDVTFARDVAPIVFEKCVYCHRPGEVGPFSLTSYREARPWGSSIKRRVVARQMPPWAADPNHGAFRNAKNLSDAEIATIAAWVDGGMKEGHPAELPALPKFTDGWQIGEPDLIVKLAEPSQIPASGTIAYRTLPTDYEFPEDTWVTAAEIRPGNRGVVHHAMTQYGEDGSAVDGPTMYSPGIEPMVYRDGYAKLIPKGTRIWLQMHYNANGTETTDQTMIGFKIAKKPVHTEVRMDMMPNTAIAVPPMVRNHEVLTAFRFPVNARLHGFRPHMHVRGADVSVSLIRPDGSRQVLLSLPKWEDGWQYFYMLDNPVTVPQGAFLEVVANYDNSPANPLNPDPTKPVRWGQQVWEEMLNFYPVWTEINDANRGDSGHVLVPMNELIATQAAGN